MESPPKMGQYICLSMYELLPCGGHCKSAKIHITKSFFSKAICSLLKISDLSLLLLTAQVFSASWLTLNHISIFELCFYVFLLDLHHRLGPSILLYAELTMTLRAFWFWHYCGKLGTRGLNTQATYPMGPSWVSCALCECKQAVAWTLAWVWCHTSASSRSRCKYHCHPVAEWEGSKPVWKKNYVRI